MTRPYLSTWDRARYSLHYLLGRVPEKDVQATLLENLRWWGIPAVGVDVGAKILRGRAAAMARKLGASREELAWINQGKTGAGIKGLVDVVGTIPPEVHKLGLRGIPLFLECKAPAWMGPGKSGRIAQDRPAEKPTDAQLAFLDTMHAAGAVVGVVWGPGDLQKILEQALAPG